MSTESNTIATHYGQVDKGHFVHTAGILRYDGVVLRAAQGIYMVAGLKSAFANAIVN